MRTFKSFLFLVLTLCYTSFANAETCSSAAFSQTTFNLNATVGVFFQQNLNSLLSCPGNGALSWNMANAPTWLSLGNTTGVLSGTPAATNLGLASFTVSASDLETGTIAQINISVSDAPIWSLANINLGIQTVGAAWSFNLNTVAKDPLGGTLSFSAQNLPSWMTLSSSGMLSGTPQSANVGSYSGIIFTATASGGSSTANGYGMVIPSGAMLGINGPSSFMDHTCQAFSVSTDLPSGVAFIPSNAISISLQDSGAAAGTSGIYANSNCSQATSSVQIAAGSSSATFYVLGSAPGILKLQASTTAFAPASDSVTIADAGTPLINLSGPAQGVVGNCIAGSLYLQDSAGNAWIPSASAAVKLSATQTDVKFYSDSKCSSSIISLNVPSGTSSSQFYLEGTVAQVKNIFASSTGFVSGSLNITLSAGAPSVEKISSTSSTVLTGTCVTVQDQLFDSFGNLVNAPSSLTNSPQSIGGSAQFYQDASCSQPSSDFILPADSNSTTFSFIPTVPGVMDLLVMPPSGITANSISFLINAPPSLAGNPLSFSTVNVGASKILPATVTNQGGPASLSSISISGNNFSIVPGGSCQASMSLATGASCTILVQYAPTAAATNTGEVTVVYNGKSLNIPVSGQGVVPPPICDSNVHWVPATAKLHFNLGDGAPGDAPYPTANTFNTQLGYQCTGGSNVAVWQLTGANQLTGKAGDNRYYTLNCQTQGMAGASLACSLVQAPPGGVHTITIGNLACTTAVASSDGTMHVSCTYKAYHPNHGVGSGTFRIDGEGAINRSCICQ